MFFITKDGRVLNSKPNEAYLGVNNYPVPPAKDDLVGYVSGFVDGKVTFEYVSPVELEEHIIPKAISQPTTIQQLMQAFSDAEIRDFEAQEERRLLAQQMTDIEVALLGGDR